MRFVHGRISYFEEAIDFIDVDISLVKSIRLHNIFIQRGIDVCHCSAFHDVLEHIALATRSFNKLNIDVTIIFQ